MQTADDAIDADRPCWSPAQQLAHTLHLCEAQVDSALSESDRAVDALIKAFTVMVEATRGVGELAQQLPEQLPQSATADLQQRIAEVHRQMTAAVIAFQFYDRLTQRLGHVRGSLSALADFVMDTPRTQQRAEWQQLLATLQRQYRTEEERQIFFAMTAEALGPEHRAAPEPVAPPGDIELF